MLRSKGGAISCKGKRRIKNGIIIQSAASFPDPKPNGLLWFRPSGSVREQMWSVNPGSEIYKHPSSQLLNKMVVIAVRDHGISAGLWDGIGEKYNWCSLFLPPAFVLPLSDSCVASFARAQSWKCNISPSKAAPWPKCAGFICTRECCVTLLMAKKMRTMSAVAFVCILSAQQHCAES